MDSSECKKPDDAPPRWQLHCAGWGCAALYACALVVANVFPRLNHRHGWPLVYMVRETRVPGDLTVFYGPWPFDDPPLVTFSAGFLAINGFLGTLLAFVAAILVIYWLRVTRLSFRFSLRTLMAGMVAISISMALVMSLSHPLHVVGMAVYVAQLSVYTVPCMVVVTTAHWILNRSKGTWHKRRLAGIHWLSWLALGLMSGPFLYHSFLERTGSLWVGRENGPPGIIALASYGWPFQHFWAEYKGQGRMWAISEGFPVSYFDPLALLGNVLVAFATFSATVFAIERWVRRTERDRHMSRGTVLMTLVAVATIVGVLTLDRSFRPDWYVYPFWLLGVACMVFTVTVLVARGFGFVLSKTYARRRPTRRGPSAESPSA